MKNFLLFLIFFCAATLSAQTEILFNAQYKPDMLYTQTIDQKTTNEISFIGDAAFLESLKEQGQENPKVENSSSKIVITVKSGLMAAGRFPVTMSFGEGSAIAVPPGTQVFGHCEPGKLPVFETVYAPETSEDFKQGFLKGMSDMLKQFSFPVKKLKIGESFTQSLPLTMPFGVADAHMEIATTYTLTKIAANLAYFDTEQAYSLKPELSSGIFSGGGSGKGTLVYDIKNSFTINFKSVLDLDMKMDSDGFSIGLKSNTTYNQDVQLSKP